MKAMKRPIHWSEVATSVVVVYFALALSYRVVALGVPKSLCWTAFGVIVAARLAHGWFTTQRPVPAGPAPVLVRVPLDMLTMGSLWAAIIR